MTNLIRTVLKHEHTHSSDRERGSRNWSAVELMSATWFVVEACIDGQVEIQRWVTTSIRQAAQIQKNLEPFRWAQIFVCMRAPLSIANATVFEVVVEAYEIVASSGYLYRLANGMSFIDAEERAQGAWNRPQELRLVYQRPPRAS